MKITAVQLRKIIKEEVRRVLRESGPVALGDPLTGEWVDTDAEWPVDVLSQYPELPRPPRGAVKVLVGTGQLHVEDSKGELYYLDGGRWVHAERTPGDVYDWPEARLFGGR